MTASVKVFGCRPVTDGATCTGAGVRKPLHSPKAPTAETSSVQSEGRKVGGNFGRGDGVGVTQPSRRCGAMRFAYCTLPQLYQFALSGEDFAGAHADKCESNQWSALANRL